MSYINKPKYYNSVLAMAKQLKPGREYHIVVQHDEWCGIFKGESCNCDYEVVPVKGKKRRYK